MILPSAMGGEPGPLPSQPLSPYLMVAAFAELKGVKNPLSLPVSKRTWACDGAAIQVASATTMVAMMVFMMGQRRGPAVRVCYRNKALRRWTSLCPGIRPCHA